MPHIPQWPPNFYLVPTSPINPTTYFPWWTNRHRKFEIQIVPSPPPPTLSNLSVDGTSTLPAPQTRPFMGIFSQPYPMSRQILLAFQYVATSHGGHSYSLVHVSSFIGLPQHLNGFPQSTLVPSVFSTQPPLSS